MSVAVRLQLLEHGPDPKVAVTRSGERIGEPFSEHRWRVVRALEHGEICRAFNLDPIRHRLDLPKMQLATGGAHRRISGYIERFVPVMPEGSWAWRPIATLHVVRDGEKFRDLDPVDPRDTFNLEQTR